MCSPHDVWWAEPAQLSPGCERAAVVLLFCLLKLLHCPGVTGCTGHSHTLQWSEQVIPPFQGVSLLSFCHADRFLFLCRQMKIFLRFKTLFLHPALLSSHTPVPSFLAHLSLSSACVGCPDYLRFLPSCHVRSFKSFLPTWGYMIASKTQFLPIPFFPLQNHYLITPPWKQLSSNIAFNFQVFMSNLPSLFHIFPVLWRFWHYTETAEILIIVF